MPSTPRTQVEAAGLRDEFEALQLLRRGVGLQDPWALRHLPRRLKTLLGVTTDTLDDLQRGLERLVQLSSEMPRDVAEHLKLCFNIGLPFGDLEWMQRTDDFGLNQTPERAGRTVRKDCDNALAEFLAKHLAQPDESAALIAPGLNPDEAPPVSEASWASGRPLTDGEWRALAEYLVQYAAIELVGMAPTALVAALIGVVAERGGLDIEIRYITTPRRLLRPGALDPTERARWQSWHAALTGLRNVVKVQARSDDDTYYKFAVASPSATENCMILLTSASNTRTVVRVVKQFAVTGKIGAEAYGASLDRAPDDLTLQYFYLAEQQSSPVLMRTVRCVLPAIASHDGLPELVIRDLSPYGTPIGDAPVSMPVALCVASYEGASGSSVLLKLRSPLTDNDDYGKLSLISARLMEFDAAAGLGILESEEVDSRLALDELWQNAAQPNPFRLPADAFAWAARREMYWTTGLDIDLPRFSYRGVHELRREDSNLAMVFVVLEVRLTTDEVHDVQSLRNSALRFIALDELYSGRTSAPLGRFLVSRREWLLEHCFKKEESQ